MDLETICRRINAKAKALQPGPELNSLKDWTWQFSLHVFVMLAKVRSASFLLITHAIATH